MRDLVRCGVALAVLAPLTVAGAGCGDGDATARSGGKLEVGTTVAPITSIVASVGGDRVHVTGIVPEGTNSHTFEPKPSVAATLAGLDVLYMNGLALEEPTKRLARETMRDGADIVELGPRAIAPRDYIYDFSFPRSAGKPNPHLWTDPVYALRYAAIVRDDLSRRAPQYATAFRANYKRFAKQLAALDKAMETSFATIPRAQRKLLTYHDAYAYFGRSYGWDIIGAIQLSDFEDPTAKNVGRLIEQVRAERVPAIFGSEVFPSPVLEQIGKEVGVRYVDVLRDDDLPGKPGEPEHSWLGLMRADYIAITEAMGGDASALHALRPAAAAAAATDAAEYPQ